MGIWEAAIAVASALLGWGLKYYWDQKHYRRAPVSVNVDVAFKSSAL